MSRGDEALSERPKQYSPLQIYFAQHLWAALSTLGQLCRAPFSSFLTSAVIAIALALPSGLLIWLQSAKQLSEHWHNSNIMSVFLKIDSQEREARKLANTIRQWPQVQRVDFISKEQGLQQFKHLSGLEGALQSLDSNPLPHVLSVLPQADLLDPVKLNALKQRISKRPEVDFVQLDMGWLQKLQSLLKLGERALWFLASVLAVSILLIIGNTLRLNIYNRRKEIVVSKLIGATAGFIRRPFIYIGMWYGLAGASLAWLILQLMLAIMAGPVHEIAGLYGSNFRLLNLGWLQSGLLFIFSVLISVSGSWLATARHLSRIEPR